jgi:hypothetical protein
MKNADTGDGKSDEKTNCPGPIPFRNSPDFGKSTI